MSTYRCPICLEEQNTESTGYNHENGCPKLRATSIKAKFPYESFKAEMDKTPIYTQSEMAEAIAANNAEWKQEYGKLVEQSRKELADCNAEWVEWVGENIIELVLNFQMTESNKQNLLHVWQDHKRGIGL